MSRVPPKRGLYERLEPCEGKLSRTVLRGGIGSNVGLLPDQTLENKQKFISQIMTSKSPVRSCEDIDETALSYRSVRRETDRRYGCRGQKNYNAQQQPAKPEPDPVDYSKIIVGAKVLHKSFGEGTITKIDQKKTKIDVAFANGSKSFIIEKSSAFNAFVKGFLQIKEYLPSSH